MRKFIISDIHGNGNLYYSVMGYLDNISKTEDITLFINGDLIDRGIESGEILIDLLNRIKSNNEHFKIVYLAGNHELMMYQTYKKRLNGELNRDNLWYDNGGYITDSYFEVVYEDIEDVYKIIDYISTLKIFHVFDEKIDNKNIVLAHAACPKNLKLYEDLKLYHDNGIVYHIVWSRKDDPYLPFKCHIGTKDCFSIVGHTPNDNKYGYYYDKEENYLNIDGGSSFYVSGYFNSDHFPLVEIKDGYLKILTFNSNNEIIYGNYFTNYENISFSNQELANERLLLNNDLNIEKLVRLPDGEIGYKSWMK